MTFYLDNIKVGLSDENNGIRLTTAEENWLIPKQTLAETKTIIEKNFKIIKDHFKHQRLIGIQQVAVFDSITFQSHFEF